MERVNLGRLYTDGKHCTYCPCDRVVSSGNGLIKHLQSVESKFHCFLIIEKLEQNDSKNQQRIQALVNSLRDNTAEHANRPPFSSLPRVNQNVAHDEQSFMDDTREEHNFNAGHHDRANGYGYGHSDNETEEEEELNMDELDKRLILDHIEDKFKKNYDRMTGYFKQLRQRMNSSKLCKSVVDNQEKMVLSKRTEDFQAKEKELIFTAQIELNYEDLNFLMKKYCISDDYEIAGASVNLSVQLKEKCQQPESQTVQSKKTVALATEINVPDQTNAARYSSASTTTKTFNLISHPANALRRNPTRSARPDNDQEVNLNLDVEKEQIEGEESRTCYRNGNQSVHLNSLTSGVSDNNLHLVPINSFDRYCTPIRTYSRADLNGSVRIKQERDLDEDSADLANTKRTRLV